VADDDHRARIARDVVLEPQSAFEVEVIGGLVEQQDIRFGEQHGGERDAHPPAAGKFGARAQLVGMGKAEAGEDRGGAGRCSMRPDVGKARLDFGDAVRVARRLGLGEERVALAIGGEHDFDQQLRPVGRFLRQPADARARGPDEMAVLEGDIARDGAEQ
jgi:hypothetical protein